MQHHWKHCQNLDNHLRQPASSVRPTLNRADATASGTWVTAGGIPHVTIDPPPLDDNLAKHLIFVMSRFIYQVGILEEHEHGLVANHAASAISTNSNGPTNLMVDIYKSASRVIAYVSASNWSITFAKVKNRILYLTSTAEENPEITDVMLLECASLDCRRLGMVLTGTCEI